MSLDSLGLDAFFACARARSFTKGAKALHITQSALSQRIQKLEQGLKASLFIRDRSGLKLTAQGERLLAFCLTRESAESELAMGMLANENDKITGEVRVGVFSTVARSLVLPALAELVKKHPHLRIRMVTRELYELPSLIFTGEVDYLFSTKEVVRSGFESLRIGSEQNVLVERRGYRGGDVYLDHDEEDTTTFEYFGKKALRIERHFLDDIYGILDGVKSGMGRAVVPKHLVQMESTLEILNPSKVLKIPIYITYRTQAFPTRSHEAILSALKEVCRKAKLS